MKKLRTAIYDFTDCEGCEVRLLSIKEKLLDLETAFDIVNWRLVQRACSDGPYDLTIIEGTPVTTDEIGLLKELRKKSHLIVSLGACASIAGIPGILDRNERRRWYERIYGPEYRPRGLEALPVSAYVKVDYMIHGCPVDDGELLYVLETLAAGKTPRPRDYAVCFDCKRAGNPCRLINREICLGPVTLGGCGAVCVSGGSACYGCFGLREGANIEGLVRVLRDFTDAARIRAHVGMFFSRMEDTREAFSRALRRRFPKGR